MDDTDIQRNIASLVTEEHSLRQGEVSEQDRQRLREVEESLDQCWDLLRQRQALREANQDPQSAHARSVRDVEGYLQ